MKKIVEFCLLVLLSYNWMSCEKPPIYSNTPTITWNSFSIDTVQQSSGALTFLFDFTDGDGDLGRDNDTTSHIMIIDTRRTPNDLLFYQIPTIERQSNISGISGTLEVTMSQLCCISPTNPLFLCQNIPSYFDPITYKIKIKDNAGNWSNEIETPPLYVKCF